MSVIKRFAIIVFSVYGFAVFLAIMFLLLPFFLLAFILPKVQAGNLVYTISITWARLFFFFTGIRYREVRKSILPKDHSYVFVSNHISYLDIPMMLLATRRFRVRILGKAEMTRIPIFGTIYNAGAVTVKRDSAENRRKSIEELKTFLKEDISILIAPEGTFNMTQAPLKSFYDGAFKIAIELKKPIVPILFPDSFQRLNYRSIFSLTPGVCRAIILPPVPTAGMVEDDMTSLKERVYSIMEKELLRFDAPWVTR